MELCLISHNVLRGDGQGRVNYELVQGVLRAGHTVTIVADQVDADLRGYVRWIRTPKGPGPTNLIEGQTFAYRSTRALRGYGGLTHAHGFVTWGHVDINTVHFVHAAWGRSPHHSGRLLRPPARWYHVAYTCVNARCEAVALQHSNVIVAVSEKVRQELVHHHHVCSERLRVIRNGVDPDEFRPKTTVRKDLGLPPEGHLSLFVGGLRSPVKNLDTILRSLATTRGTTLIVAGDLKHSPYPSLAAKLGVANRIRFLGFRTDVADLMAAADSFIFPSHYESDSLVLREAMAVGLPVLTARSVGAAELLVDGSNGFVLPDENDVVALAERWQWMADHPLEAEAIGRRARLTALECAWDHMVRAYIALYDEVLLRKHPQHR